MSWWINLEGAGPVEHFEDGGTYVLGGQTNAELNITYNYGGLFRTALRDSDPDKSNVLGRLFHGKKAGDTIEMLRIAVEELGTETSNDYWEPTPGNAGKALSYLLAWAEQYPDCVWAVE